MTSPSPAASPGSTARLVFLPLWLGLSSLTVPAVVAAQTPSQPPPPHSVVTDTSQPQQPPAHLAVVEGTVTLERDARVEPALANVPLLAGDRVRTEAGHVAVRFGSGSMLELDRFSDVDLQADSLVQLLSGALHVVLVSNVACSPPESWCLAYRIDAAPGSVVLHTVGDYRVSLSNLGNDPRIDLTVLHGSATLQNGRGTVLVGAGSRAWAYADVPPSQPVPADTTASTLDDRFAAVRRAARVSAPPPQHLPAELAEYRWRARSSRILAHRAAVRRRLVPTRRRRLAPVRERNMVVRAKPRLGLDWRRALVVANAPLRALGSERDGMVLGPWPSVGARLGGLGLHVAIRELVSARADRRASGESQEFPNVRECLVPAAGPGVRDRRRGRRSATSATLAHSVAANIFASSPDASACCRSCRARGTAVDRPRAGQSDEPLTRGAGRRVDQGRCPTGHGPRACRRLICRARDAARSALRGAAWRRWRTPECRPDGRRSASAQRRGGSAADRRSRHVAYRAAAGSGT